MEKQIKNHPGVIIFLAVCLLGCFAYSPSINEPLFFIDDGLYLSSVPRDGFTLKNLLYVLTPVTKPVYLPLVDLTYLIDLNLAGWFGVSENAWMRVVNMIWLAASAVWVLKIFNLRPGHFQNTPDFSAVGMGVAILFALHPLHAIPTAWIAARKDALVCFMGLGFVYQILKRRHARAFIFYVLAFASKQSAYGLFLWVLAAELFFAIKSLGINRKMTAFYLKTVAPFFLFFLVFFPLSFSLSSAHPRANVYVFPQTLLTYLFYVLKVFVPYPLTHYYGRPAALNLFLTIGSLAAIAAAFVLTYWLGFKEKISSWVALLGFFTFLAMLPYFSVFPAMLLINNSYAYTLVAPCLLLLFAGVSKMHFRKEVYITLFLVLIGSSVVYSRSLTKEFSEPIAAFERNVSLYPQERFLQVRLAQAAQSEGDLKLAKKIYLQILDQRMQEAHRISTEAFDGIADICASEKDSACVDFLVRTATRNTHAYYCRRLLEKNLPLAFNFDPCIKKYPGDFKTP